MATLSDRTGDVVASSDKNADGQVDQRDDRIAAQEAADSGTAPGTVKEKVGRAQVDEGLAARRRLQARTATATSTFPAAETDQPVVAPPVEADRPVVAPVVQGPRPRASLVATMSLILGVVGAVAVLTGVLAGPGVAVGLLGALLGLGGVAATSRRHVAGKSDALLGIALGLAAVVVGVLALTGNLSWLNGNTNTVTQVHDWFAAHMAWLLP